MERWRRARLRQTNVRAMLQRQDKPNEAAAFWLAAALAGAAGLALFGSSLAEVARWLASPEWLPTK